MITSKNNTLLISESFFSVQGEGITSGYPSYFIRLANCNLSCGMRPKMLNQFKRGERTDSPSTFKGDLHEEGKATWTCDSIPVWVRGEEVLYSDLIDSWVEEGIEQDIRSGLIHIIWTGGEPTIPSHQKAISSFVNYYRDWVQQKDEFHTFNPYFEIETNGSLYISDELFWELNQINCSAKLANSGMSAKSRINPSAIERIMEHELYQFKFVISTEDDIKELMKTYVKPFNIPLQNVVCMPGLDSQEDYHERTKFVMEMAKKYKFIGLSRMHVSAWNQVTGC